MHFVQLVAQGGVPIDAAQAAPGHGVCAGRLVLPHLAQAARLQELRLSRPFRRRARAPRDSSARLGLPAPWPSGPVE
eukprot:4751758-Pyramimonas_sp.AAC.1